ncbi:MAG: hypothetical protein GTO02_11660, partial [Candidatus Dadabacteria bacterium]|nr:hypothetical protein [Candidatus Dadabacteria bacterium]
KPCHVCGSIRGNYTEFWNFCSACGLPPVIHEYVDSYVKGKEEVSKLKERRELLRFYHPYVTDSQVKEDMERYLEETEQELKNNLGIMY